MDISLWSAGKNYLKGEWQKIVDVTPSLLNHFTAMEGVDSSTSSILRKSGLCWTSQPDFGLLPHPPLPGSLLIIGNRGGSASLLRYQTRENTIKIEANVSLSQTWLTYIAASPWTSASNGQCTSYLAFGSSDGLVGLARLNQALATEEPSFAFIQKPNIVLSVEKIDEPVLSQDKAGITALEWVHTAGGSDILVVCKPGVVNLWVSSDDSRLAWSGLRSLALERQRISSGASPFHPASGVSYTEHNDRLLITLFDGSIHVIQELTKDPQWKPSIEDGDFTSKTLSQRCRTIFTRVESGPVDSKVMNCINGFSIYGSGSTFVWAHE
ncbi:hypothetical protein EST38_g7968 [Candolleomyces aberdarensis]|uniref:Transcription factor IIIC 90kDa subunit N-terminal domain-containing protein n=1 Tax=Candolleomyces aberdarensis TaxID=2316362 RepID=A0A4Q2DH84_9AGAR|nr:hypothetical protein EST38_g7968 [Candolleomyces aberdarensis]